MLQFNGRSLIAAIVCFFILVFIALHVHDTIIRPFFGDFLAVVWLFFVAKSVWEQPVFRLVTGVLLVAWGVEFAQYLDVISWLGLEEVRVARIVLGATFDPVDLLAYTAGAGTILLADRIGGLRWLARPSGLDLPVGDNNGG